ncbi:MAG: hypothetical protein NT155_02095 [Candidatus Staskawiczbacteria bacterium]|nr:hypothetical protein [Candidatus Staskawiczbacteria bacterium]
MGEKPRDVEEAETIPEDKIYKLILKMPEDPALREKLEKKLEEYEGRTAEREKAKKEQPPIATYKEVILRFLLKDGAVKMSDLLKDLSEIHGNVDRTSFDNAAKVIEAYVKGGKVSGGTGLK